MTGSGPGLNSFVRFRLAGWRTIPVSYTHLDVYKRQVQKQLANNLLKGVLPKVSNERGGKYTAKAVTDGEYDTYWATEDLSLIHILYPKNCISVIGQ